MKIIILAYDAHQGKTCASIVIVLNPMQMNRLGNNTTSLLEKALREKWRIT